MLTYSRFRNIGWCRSNCVNSILMMHNYLYTAVSGMDSAVPLTGRPYGGCCIFYRSLAWCVSPCQIASRRLCAISVQLSDDSSLLLVNVYFPVDDSFAARRDLIFVLGELEALIATQQFDHRWLLEILRLIFHVTHTAKTKAWTSLRNCSESAATGRTPNVGVTVTPLQLTPYNCFVVIVLKSVGTVQHRLLWAL